MALSSPQKNFRQSVYCFIVFAIHTKYSLHKKIKKDEAMEPKEANKACK